MEHSKGNIVIFPFMAQGHIVPFFALALQIQQKGYSVTLVNTPLNISNLRSSLPPNSKIRLLEIPFNPSDHGLPPEAENTDGLPYPLVIRLLDATAASLKPHFRNILSGLIASGQENTVCVVADLFFGWSADVAREFGVFHVLFSGAGGFGLACYYSMWLNLPHRKTDSVEFTLEDFPESGRFHVTQLSSSVLSADGTDPWSVFQRENFLSWVNTDGILFNTVEELDTKGLTYFRRKFGRPVWPIGPILLPEGAHIRGKEFGIDLQKCVEWLDSKASNSVLFISFGSQNTVSATQTMAMAKALDATGRNFIWVIRPPLGFDPNAEFKPEDWLPEGFIEKVEEDEKRGLIVVNWAPQVEILFHESTGAFLTHCGWNSVLEALSHGVPIIGWPMAAEQFYNAKFLEEEVGVCVEMARGTHFEVRCEDIVDKIERVMGENNKGKEMRRRACQVKEIIREATRGDDDDGFNKGSSVKAMEDFLNAAFLIKDK